MRYNYILSAALLGIPAVVVQEQVAVALTENQVDTVAQKFTVLIDSINKSSGSGVIVKKEGNLYSVLTNWHVVDETVSNYRIITPDGQSYPINEGSVTQIPEVDAAIIQFTSNTNYQVATLGNSNSVQRNQKVYSAGFPGRSFAINSPIYHFVSGKVIFNADISKPVSRKGYSLIYDNAVLPGMSGGPILNQQGELVGINGKVEIYSYDIPKLNPEFYRIRTGRSLGVPIQIYKQWASRQEGAGTLTNQPNKKRLTYLVTVTPPKQHKRIPVNIQEMLVPTIDFFTSVGLLQQDSSSYPNHNVNFYLNQSINSNIINQKQTIQDFQNAANSNILFSAPQCYCGDAQR